MANPISYSGGHSSVSPFSYSEKLKEFVKSPVFGKLTKPGTVKKTMHIVRKAIFTVDLYTGKVHCYELCKGMKTFGDMLDFYGSYKNIVGWAEYFSTPFSEKTFDKEKAQDSLKAILLSQKIFTRGGKQILKDKQAIDVCVQTVIGNVKLQHFGNEKEARKILKNALVEYLQKEAGRPKVVRNTADISLAKMRDISTDSGSSEESDAILFNPSHLDRLVDSVVLKQKSYSTAFFIALGCFTVSDLGDNILTLQKWGLIDISRFSARCASCATKIGTKVPIFAFVGKVTLGTAVSLTSSVALTLIIGINGYQGAQALLKYLDKESTEADVRDAKKKMWSASVCILDASVGLACTVAPLCFTFNPFVGIVVLPVASKVTGLMRTFLL